MLSYRHAFHAGNHADVLKHMTLIALARHLNQKDKPWWYIDTHAGAGFYALDSGYATKLAEYEGGVGRLWDRTDAPPLVADYLSLVRHANPNGKLTRYPGSPWFIEQLLREQDRMRLFELHTTEVELLGRNFHHLGNRSIVTLGDGLAGLKACLPPPPRRALTLIDPSFENKRDYAAVVAALKDALGRFANGTYAVWYPQLSRLEARELPERLEKLPAKTWLHATLAVGRPGHDKGMYGSGMFIINPPWTLQNDLSSALPWLAKALSQDEGAGFTLEAQSA
ncbi:MAG: ribosomal large subunit methyltransferase [Pseudomonadota bacterium]|jgi:23S rRNA (adenine2030-N6)-methyltransferase